MILPINVSTFFWGFCTKTEVIVHSAHSNKQYPESNYKAHSDFISAQDARRNRPALLSYK